jgi:hypothetical protein
MTEKQISNGNKLIAFFMGFEHTTKVTIFEYSMDFKSGYEDIIIHSNKKPKLKFYNNYSDFFEPDDQEEGFKYEYVFKYDNSWDSLMPVVNQINKLTTDNKESIIRQIAIQDAVKYVCITEAFERTIDFIQWYLGIKIYQIVLYDSIKNTVQKEKNFRGTIEQLKIELYKMQLEYCEDEKPKIKETIVTSEGKKLNVLMAESDVDFSYMVVLSEIN